MKEQTLAAGHTWFSLGEASKMVGVNQITLRLWADKGLVRVFKTAGGHRRFAEEDLLLLLREQASPVKQGDLADRAVKGFRRQVKSPKVTPLKPDAIDADSRSHLRVLGHRLAQVVIRYHGDRRERPELLEEARFIGIDYAIENQKLGQTLTQAVEFFLSHRNKFIEIVQGLLPSNVSRDEPLTMVRDMAAVSDAVLLALIAQYQKTGVVNSPDRTTST